tara:strand:+ start:18757 stop:19665 length:909 start_codon:yes stop_codon:yes gene_type:complete
MTFTLETGAGTPGANAYCTTAFVTTYLADRARSTENAWDTIGTPRQQQAVVAGTDYIEKRWGPRVKGSAFRPEITGRNAKATIAFASLPLDTEDVTVGTQVFRFVAVLAQENDVLIGADVEESIDNLVAASIGGVVAGTNYHEDTRQNFEATLTKNADDTSLLDVVADMTGENGNEIPLASTVTGATVSSATLLGGIDHGAQPLTFPKAGLYTPKGILVVGIPLKLKQATAEYSMRSLLALLAPDPEIDATSAAVKKKRDKVGPIEEEREYVDGAVPRVFHPYPAADQLLAEYVLPAGGTFR